MFLRRRHAYWILLWNFFLSYARTQTPGQLGHPGSKARNPRRRSDAFEELQHYLLCNPRNRACKGLVLSWLSLCQSRQKEVKGVVFHFMWPVHHLVHFSCNRSTIWYIFRVTGPTGPFFAYTLISCGDRVLPRAADWLSAGLGGIHSVKFYKWLGFVSFLLHHILYLTAANVAVQN